MAIKTEILLAFRNSIFLGQGNGKATIYNDQTRDLFNTLPTKLNTLLSPLP
jgi:hypothetical protein